MSQRLQMLILSEDPSICRELQTAGSFAKLDVIIVQDRRQLAVSIGEHPKAMALVVMHSDKSSAASPVEILHNVRSTHKNLRRVVVADSADLSGVMEGLY